MLINLFLLHSWHSYDIVVTSIKLPGQAWKKVDDFIFADGTTNEPQPIREIAENNYLSNGVRVFGFALFGISMAIGCSALVWVFAKRSTAVVKAAQPEFLSILCLGSITTSLAIITLSFDESHGWTDGQLDRACMSTPWLFVLGYVMAYSALYSKVNLPHLRDFANFVFFLSREIYLSLLDLAH